MATHWETGDVNDRLEEADMSTTQVPGVDPEKLQSARGAAPSADPTISAALLTKERIDDADARACEIEQQMTDDERFSLIISFMGYIPGSAVGGRDARIPEGVNMSAGYTPAGCRGSVFLRYRARTPAWASRIPATDPMTKAPLHFRH